MTSQAEQLAERDRHRPDAAGAAMDEHPSPSAAKPRSNRLTQTVNNVSGIAAASIMRQRLGHRQAGARRRDAIFGIAAARDQRADLLADQPARPLARRHDLAGDLEPRNVASARRRRIKAAALQHVGPVDPGRGHPDQHLARPGPRHRPLDQLELFGSAGFGGSIAIIGGDVPYEARLIDLAALAVNVGAMDLDDLFPSKPDDPLIALASRTSTRCRSTSSRRDRDARSRDRPRRSAYERADPPQRGRRAVQEIELDATTKRRKPRCP